MASERSDKKDVHFEMVEQNEGKELLYAVNKTAERTKKEMIRKACQWCCDKCHEECYYDDKNDCMTIQSITKAMNQ